MFRNLKERFITEFSPVKAIMLAVCVAIFIGVIVFIGFNVKTMYDNDNVDAPTTTSFNSTQTEVVM